MALSYEEWKKQQTQIPTQEPVSNIPNPTNKILSYDEWRVDKPTISNEIQQKPSIENIIGGLEASFAGGLIKKSSDYLSKLTNIGKSMYLGFGGAAQNLKEAQNLEMANQNYSNLILGNLKKVKTLQEKKHYQDILKNIQQQEQPNFNTTNTKDVKTPFDTAQQSGEEFAQKADSLATEMGTPDFLKKVAEGIGSFSADSPAYVFGGEAVKATKLPEIIGGIFANPKVFPTIGKYVSPFISNTIHNIGAFGVAGAINGQSLSSIVRDSSLFAILPSFLKSETLINKALTLSGDALFMGGVAKLDGANNEDAGVAAVIGGIMGVSGLLGERGVGTREQAIEKLKDVAQKIVDDPTNKGTEQEKNAQKILDGSLDYLAKDVPTKEDVATLVEEVKTTTPTSIEKVAPEKIQYDLEPGFVEKINIKNPKIQSMIADIKAGKDMPPIPVYKNEGGTFTTNKDGSHRLTAYKQLGVDVPIKIESKTKLTATAKQKTERDQVEHTKFASRVFERMKAEHPSLEGELGYDPIKLKEDAQKAVELVATDKQKAFDIAMGKEVSSDITSAAVNIAMAEKALSEGNNALYAKLIRNRSLAQTRRGQELVAEKGSVSDNSTSRYVKELIATRLDKLGEKYLSGLRLKSVSRKERAIEIVDREVAKVQKNIKRGKLDVKTALSLLDKLACI